jgi:adenylate cyclase
MPARTRWGRRFFANDPPARSRSLVDRLLSIGAYAEESDTQRGRRRIIVAAIWLGTLLTFLGILSDLAAGYPWSALGNTVIIVVTVASLVTLDLRPWWFTAIINLLFTALFLVQLIQTALFGGLLDSGLVVAFGLLIVLAALLAIGIQAASWWFAAFVASVFYALVIPNWIDPVYVRSDAGFQSALTLIALGVVIFAALTHFVRQRDRFQRDSDRLLHSILPDEIVARLKTTDTKIVDSFESATVLFADVVDFTSLSSEMLPEDLVALLDSVFTTFDGFVDELGLEKIKTVGDAYMVASGVPAIRSDHAQAMAELALRVRDYSTTHEFEGRRISLRIGINSGPVVAGVIGSHKFSYDLWGDVVNTASRMESEGARGAIQVSSSTYELIKDRFVCVPRGVIPVKGKGPMATYLLVSRRAAYREGDGLPNIYD